LLVLIDVMLMLMLIGMECHSPFSWLGLLRSYLMLIRRELCVGAKLWVVLLVLIDVMLMMMLI